MGMSFKSDSLVVHAIGIRQYRSIYSPWSTQPIRTYEGASSIFREVRRGLDDLTSSKEDVGEIHLLDYTHNTGRGVRDLVGIRVDSRDECFWMSFPGLSLLGDTLSVVAARELLARVGLDEGAIDKLERAAKAQRLENDSHNQNGDHGYILVALINK